jgi:hypothetical protein
MVLRSASLVDLDDHPAILLPAVGSQFKELFRELVQVSRERQDLSNKTFALSQTIIAVLVKRDLKQRLNAMATRSRKFIDDVPKLRFSLIDQAIHAV